MVRELQEGRGHQAINIGWQKYRQVIINQREVLERFLKSPEIRKWQLEKS
jgi:hypothetical protein